MKKLTIKDVVKFKRKSEGSRKTFIRNLKNVNEANGDPRDYWVRCLSGIKNTFKTNDPQYISDKIDKLRELLLVTTLHSNTIKQYNHNITILGRFENFDFSILKPSENIKILSQPKENKILTISGLPVEVAPSFVFSFENDNNKEVGAVWFIAQKDGFKSDELGMFTDILHRYLNIHFLGEYDINSIFCITVDLYKGTYLNYSQLEQGEVPRILDSMINKIKDLI